MTSNVLNNIKSQATNGLNQTPEKKPDGPNVHSTNEPIENEVYKRIVIDCCLMHYVRQKEKKMEGHNICT